jgi:predicted dehydrogenase
VTTRSRPPRTPGSPPSSAEPSIVPDEPGVYGYEAENRHFVRAFLGKETPRLTFDDGLEVVQLLMTAYRSAEEGRTLAFDPDGVDSFVPAVARGAWIP